MAIVIDTQSTEETQGKAYPHCGIDEYLLDERKPFYAGVYDDTGVIRLSNVPITPVHAENPDISPRGDVPFEVFLQSAPERHWLMHALFEAENETRWSGEVPRDYAPVAPIDEQRAIEQIDNDWENATILYRTNGERVSLIVGESPYPEVLLTVSTDVYGTNDGPDREQINLSIPEARLLRDLLNRANLDQLDQ